MRCYWQIYIWFASKHRKPPDKQKVCRQILDFIYEQISTFEEHMFEKYNFDVNIIQALYILSCIGQDIMEQVVTSIINIDFKEAVVAEYSRLEQGKAIDTWQSTTKIFNCKNEKQDICKQGSTSVCSKHQQRGWTPRRDTASRSGMLQFCYWYLHNISHMQA